MKGRTMKRLYPYITITSLVLALLFVPLLSGENLFFGSEGDWYSQHVGAAENLRQMMRSTGTIFPQFSTAGGGSNIYDLAYYGLLRPDILFSCLIPEVPMKYIIAVYAAAGTVAAVNLCYYWLRKKGMTWAFAMAATVIFAASTGFFHTHHQIMFVNYLPYLILALMGVDRFLQKGKSGMLIGGLFLIYIHSYFYAFSCLTVCAIYFFWQLTLQENMTLSRGIKTTAYGAIGVLLSIAMAAVLLLPTGLDILSTEKDAGVFAQENVPIADLDLSGLLYQPYGCGLTLAALYLLILSLTKKKTRLPAALILLCMALPLVSYVLNGFLYPREKILIPFLPLIALVCADTLEGLWQGKNKYYLLPAAICFLPAIESRWQTLMIVEGIVLLLWIFLQRCTALTKTIKAAAFTLILIVPVCTNLSVNLGMEDYLKADDIRQSHFTFGDIYMFADDHRYRFDYLSNNYVNSNLAPDGRIYKTAMYSSVTNQAYAEFYYDTMGNPISLRNRVVLMPNQNPCFNYFMGLRYLLADESYLPAGYTPVFRRNERVLAENENVLPVAYGTWDLLGEETFDALSRPEKTEALTRWAVIDGKDKNGEGQGSESTVKALPLPTNLEEQLSNDGKTKSVEVPLNQNLEDKVIFLTFRVDSLKGKQVEILVNGMKNNLSAVNAAYPNHNNQFTYVFSGQDLKTLDIRLSKGSYRISQIQAYTMDMPDLKDRELAIPTLSDEAQDGSTMFAGQIEMKRDGYFVTSFPYKEGYEISVDGRMVTGNKINTAFLGFPLEKGNHEIRISFTAPGFRTGRAVSAAALAAYLVLLVIERKRGK